jgi:peptide/nickel transport system substrate-binding protein
MSTTRRNFLKTGAALTAMPFIQSQPAAAAGRDTPVAVTAQTINSLELHRPGTNCTSCAVAASCYDRLVTFGTKDAPGGGLSYDYASIQPELAESWEISEDGMTLTFTLKDATFQDGSPVTAEDVKWSFDRAVSVGGFPTVQMKAGGLERPDRFEAVDDKTFVVKLDRPSKLSLPDLAVHVPFIINATLAKEHATADDPWAMEYLHKNTMGSDAFKVTRWDPGQQVVYERNEAWAGGPVPSYARVIMRELPSSTTQRAMVERGACRWPSTSPTRAPRSCPRSSPSTRPRSRTASTRSASTPVSSPSRTRICARPSPALCPTE